MNTGGLRAVLGTLVVAGAVVLAGCGGTPTVSSVDPVVEVEATPSVEPEVAPAPIETSAPPVAEEPSSVGTVTSKLTDSNGYVAELTVEWLPITTLTADEIRTNCPEVAEIIDLSAIPFEHRNTDGVGARVTISYPDVNGFVWSGGAPAISVRGGDDDSYSPFECGPGADGVHPVPLPVAPAGGTVMIYGLGLNEKTPENPNGETSVPLSTFEFYADDRFMTCEGAEGCVFPYPG